MYCNSTGWFTANAALGNNIIVYIFDRETFAQFEKGHIVSALYESKKIESDIFEVVLVPGAYHIVMSNMYSEYSTKTVQLQASGLCL